MAELEYAFLADAADAQPGQKFAVIGGGVSRIGGPGFPLRHPHLAMVVGLLVEPREFGREHELRFAVDTPEGDELSGASAVIRADGSPDSRDAVLTFSLDLWNLVFPTPGDYSIRITIDGEERKQIPLVIEQYEVQGTEGVDPGARPLVPPFPPPTGQA